MLENITKTKEQIWNERLEHRMKEMNLSQRKFIAQYKSRFGTGSQADISKWMHVGDLDSRTKKPRRFPEFETMQKIAEILEVSVGYLIGETDFETFDQERASAYMGLSSSSITAIRNITTGKAIPPFYKYPNAQRTAALEKLLESTLLVDYLKDICDLAEVIDREKKQIDFFESAKMKIPEKYRNDAVALWDDPEKAVNQGVIPTEELRAFIRFLDDAVSDELSQPDTAAREIKAARFALQERQSKIIDEIISPEKLSTLLPHYATHEELEAILNKSKNQNDNHA